MRKDCQQSTPLEPHMHDTREQLQGTGKLRPGWAALASWLGRQWGAPAAWLRSTAANVRTAPAGAWNALCRLKAPGAGPELVQLARQPLSVRPLGCILAARTEVCRGSTLMLAPS